MEKDIKIVKKGSDKSNLEYWLSLSPQERLKNLEGMRKEINAEKYDSQQGFQRVHRIIKR